ncbi:dTDP-D-glucose 4,6-dehydratase-like protein [Aspergillus steynii IBT 23096]|uniref:dTDP-D-glucose 4,6-dehydratase-like protein n=1 Tax=Aspergillus steynii IBT 23096 TaxID=1392250 RepID=A0A2I2GKP8_9EURO|nr:dTDP-D-glucose 4,6-dehydratase-like protein [Aspergillus steynii IBT 23096]PLB53460.1 dTDP-D-glucose 4,6-dehydratase-like protein [Aspergillus steynii IBT 23096]
MQGDDPSILESLQLIGTTKFEPRSDIKNILITGGAGFIGGWVTRHLTVQYPEYTIVCFDKIDRVSSLANISCLEAFSNFHFVEGDLTDAAAVSTVLAEYDIDCVLHFAACSHVQNSFEDPSSFTINNVVGTQQLLEAIRHRHGVHSVRRFIHVSTDEVYGEAVGGFIDEKHQFQPTNPYAASKAAAEMYVWAYAKSFGLPALVVRSNNVYGPCQYPEKIIPRFCTLLSKQQPLTIQGSGLHVRRYLYGADAADGFDTLLHKGQLGEAYNINSALGVTNIEVAVRMLELYGYRPEEFKSRLAWIADRPFNDHDYRVDGSKLAALGWRQRIPFPEGLRTTMHWYRKHTQAWWPNVPEKVTLVSTTGPRNDDA